MLIYHVKHIIVISVVKSEERQFVKNYAIFSFVLEDKNTPKEKEKIRKHIHRKILSLSHSIPCGGQEQQGARFPYQSNICEHDFSKC